MNTRGRRGRAPEAPAQQAAVTLELETPEQLRFTRTEVVVGAAVGVAVIAAGSALGMWLKENLGQRAETESDQTQLSPAPESARFCELKEAKGGVLVREEGVYYLSGYPRQVREWYLPNGYSGEVPCYWELSLTDPVETDLGSYGRIIRYDTQAANGGPAQTIVSMDIVTQEGGIIRTEIELTSFEGGEGIDQIRSTFNGEVVGENKGHPGIKRKEGADFIEDELEASILGRELYDWLQQFMPQDEEGRVPEDLAPWLDPENCPEAEPQPGEVAPTPLGPTML